MAQAVSQLEAVAGEVNAQMRYALERLLRSKGEHLTEADIADAIKRVSRIPVTSTTEARGIALATADRVDRFNRRDVRRAIGIDVPEYSSALGEKWRREHIALIKSIGEDAKQRFTGVLREASKKQTRIETIAQALKDNEGITHRRARLIARDQVLTINAKLNRDRQERAGIEEYIWHTVRDGSVRGNHSHLHGKRFRFDDPPMGGGTSKNERGNPGDGIGCRCQAIPVIPEFEKPEPKPEKKPAPKAEPKRAARPAPPPRRVIRTRPAREIPDVRPEVSQYIQAPPPAPPPPPPVELKSLPYAPPPRRMAPDRNAVQASEKVKALASASETEAVTSFTGDDYQDIRRAEMAGDKESKFGKRSKELQSLINKAAEDGHAYEGTVYRGLAEVPEEVVQSFALKDNVIDMRGTSSSSTSLSVSEGYARLDRDIETGAIIEPTTTTGWSVVFRFPNKRGVPIMRMSDAGPTEHEVLQPLDAKFRVVSAFRPEGTSRVLYVDVEAL